MNEFFSTVFGNRAVRDYAFATVAIGLVAFLGVGAIVKAVEWAQIDGDPVPRAQTAQTRTFEVTRSILDDSITTGSLTTAAADTRLDPCRIDPRRLTSRP